jgi:hypothetical protein
MCHFKDMPAKATPSDTLKADNRTKPALPKRSHQGATYQKVPDGRKRPIRGLWIRGSRYYARVVPGDNVGDVPATHEDSIGELFPSPDQPF